MTIIADDTQGAGGTAVESYTFEAGLDADYYYRDTGLTDESGVTEYIDFTLTIDDYLSEGYEGVNFALSLVVEAVQVVNNGTSVANAEWATGMGSVWNPEAV